MNLNAASSGGHTGGPQVSGRRQELLTQHLGWDVHVISQKKIERHILLTSNNYHQSQVKHSQIMTNMAFTIATKETMIMSFPSPVQIDNETPIYINLLYVYQHISTCAQSQHKYNSQPPQLVLPRCATKHVGHVCW